MKLLNAQNTRPVLCKLHLENGAFTKNTLKIANILNSYFVNVGRKGGTSKKFWVIIFGVMGDPKQV